MGAWNASASKETGPGMRLLRGALSAAARLGPVAMASAALLASDSFFAGATLAGRIAMSAMSGTLLCGTFAIAAGCFLTGSSRPCPREPAVPPEAVEQEWKVRLAAGAARLNRMKRQKADAGFVPAP